MIYRNSTLSVVAFLMLIVALPARGQDKPDPFRRDNLVAWCIVPFDSAKRTPAERAEMLDKMGIHALAYDYRAEHIASFDEELDQLAKHHIKLTAWWFPTTLNDEARLILKVLDKHNVKTQLWVTGGGAETKSPEEQKARVESEAARVRTIAEAAAKQGCTVALYNHGSWFGEPENQIAIIERLKQDQITNVGIVYNLHHGHHHLARFKELLKRMQPYLMALNLNGMVPDGDAKGQKILPLGTGSADAELLKIIRDSGFNGPIGILNHTDNDAEKRLLDNLDGLNWLLPQLDGKPAGKAPEYRTWKGALKAALDGGQLFGTKVDYHQFPLSIVCRAQLPTAEPYNILVAHHTKASGHHWELFTQAGNGRLSMYMPGYSPSLVASEVNVCDGQTHNLACVLQENRVQLFIDQRLVADEAVTRGSQPPIEGRLAVGRLVEGGLECYGTLEFVQLLAGIADFTKPLSNEPNKSLRSIDAWQFASATTATTGSGQTTTATTSNSSGTTTPAAASVPQQYDAAVVKELAQSALASGKAERGVTVFASARMACLSCHKIGTAGGSVGPELTQIGKQRTAEQLAESVLWPNQHVEDKYKVFQALTDEGLTVQGYKVSESDRELVLREPATGKETRLSKTELEAIRNAPSVMPEGMAAALTKEQQQDLIAFLADLGHHKSLRAEIAQSVLDHAQSHEAAGFDWNREPLDKSARYDWQAYVNRDRVYDFYTKEANHFRTQARFEPLLAEYPGIDGGKQGHWGNQNESSWESDAWNLTLLDQVQAGVFRGDKLTVSRAVCARLGDTGEMSVCFDPDSLSYRALWQGGFVKFSKVRHGFINGMEADGVRIDLPESAARVAGEGKAGDGKAKYHGYYRAGQRIVFAYRLGDIEYLDSPWVENGQFVREVAPREKHSLARQIAKPAATTIQSFTTPVKLGTVGPYAIDTIELPWDNPWKALIYCGDHDFLPDGSALVATMQGDVWHVSGFGQRDGQWSTQATWRRFASGLHHALGLRVGPDGIFVLCRDQLTRLHDLNGDGQADWYECFSNAFETSPAGHDYICGLQRDNEGNFYTASGNQGLVRISYDGTRAQTIAGGFRNPDGLGIYPDGTLTVPCSEGEWTPASMICAVPKAKWSSRLDQPTDLTQLPFYGYRGSQYIKQPITKPELPFVFLPRGVDNSAGGQVFIDSDRFGPLKGNMVHLSFGTGSYFVLLRDEVRGQLQGAVMPMPGQFLSGVHRGKFSPIDGQLYVSGMAGWGSYTTDRGCFQRVRYTGQPVQLPIGFHLHENGVVVSFAEKLDREFCENAKEHFAQSWNYRYSSAYGSAEYSALHYGMRGHDQLRIASAHVLPDGRSLFLELPDLQLCNQLHLQVASGSSERFDLLATCNALDAPFSSIPSVKSAPKTLAAHPLEADMNMATKRLPNPWRKSIPGARAVRIEAGKNLSYSTRELRAKAGEAIALTLVNPDVVPHNWALTQPGKLSSVGAEANKLVADPEGMVRQYVPQTSEVICYTDVVDPLDQATIYFKTPNQPGRYPFLCTFPGHWMVMNGELIVE